METFTQPKPLTDNPHYSEQRRKSLAAIDYSTIDAPITEIVAGFNKMAHCFTLQSCYGHFLYKGQTDPHNLAPLPVDKDIGNVEYRIAYLALCIENSEAGRALMAGLQRIGDIDRQNIQFGSAEWFWNTHLNSYVLQVEPDRFKYQDRAKLGYTEALSIENIRTKFFIRLNALLRTQLGAG